ncbi:hypothetical protein MMC18_007084 [Xylographa bjoerkii]|nr:hypothetical protein [Xylographa bjoerkii]
MPGSKQTSKAEATATKAVKKPDVTLYFLTQDLPTNSVKHRTGRNGYPVGPPDPLPGHSTLGAPPLVNDGQLMHDLCLDWTEEQAKALNAANGYSPIGVWAFEKLSMVYDVEGYLKAREVAGHKKPKPVQVLDMSRFKIIGPNENAIVHDDKGIVAVVIRDFLPIPELVDHCDALAAKHISMSRDIRVSW